MGISTGTNITKVTESDLEQARQKYIARAGRPSRFSPELVAEILVRLEEGESLQAICRDDHMPAVSTVYDWRGNIPVFAEALTRARRNAATSLAEGGLSILDGLHEKTDRDGNPISPTMTTVRLAEMRSRYRMELAKCFDRQTFGDKQKVTAEVNIAHTVGGIIENIMGKTPPLVVRDAEHQDAPLIDCVQNEPVA
jgi:hypothetical protein